MPLPPSGTVVRVAGLGLPPVSYTDGQFGSPLPVLVGQNVHISPPGGRVVQFRGGYDMPRGRGTDGTSKFNHTLRGMYTPTGPALTAFAAGAVTIPMNLVSNSPADPCPDPFEVDLSIADPATFSRGGSVTLSDANPTNFTPDILVAAADLPGGPLATGDYIVWEAQVYVWKSAIYFYGERPGVATYRFVMLRQSVDDVICLYDETDNGDFATTSALLTITGSDDPAVVGATGYLRGVIVSGGLRLQAEIASGRQVHASLRPIARVTSTGITRYGV